MTPTVIRTVAELRQHVANLRASGETVALIPTMGALHDGHLSLVRKAIKDGHQSIVSIFVNPTQFNDPKDLEKYPRDEATDVALLAPLNVSAVFAPSADEMYSDGYSTTVSVSGVSEGLCGAARPGHFDGVATVVSKLLLQCLPDAAYFGKKDFQQISVINRVVIDLNIPVQIVGCPILREADGLAMSSRNVRLTEKGRIIAGQLNVVMRECAQDIAAGSKVASRLKDAKSQIMAAGFTDIDYLEMRSSADLKPIEKLDQPARLFVAAFLDNVRLIDNFEVGAEVGKRTS